MIKFTFWVSIVLTLAGCMATRPPTLDRMGPGGNRFAAQSPNNELDSLLDKYSGSSSSKQEPSREVYQNRLSASAQLQLGMDKQNVQIQLGSPSEVEVAGQAKYGNERWTYEDTFSTVNGYVTATKLIYFENHRVVGWETN